MQARTPHSSTARPEALRALAASLALLLATVWLLAGSVASAAPATDGQAPQWWERGQDTWYYKDDWKALYLTGGAPYRKSIEIPEPVKAAYAYVWGTGTCTLKVNGKEVGTDVDEGTIEDYDLTKLLVPGTNTLEVSGGEVICEGAAVLRSGKEVLFASDASWGGPGTKASRERQGGPRGYSGETHMARMVEVTLEQKAIYQFHFYGPHTGDCHREDLWYPRYAASEERFISYEGWEERMLAPIRFHIRTRREVLHGEFGLSFLGPEDAPRAWLEDVLAIHEKYRMHWAWWNYAGNEIHRTGLVAGSRENPLVSTLAKYARMKAPE